MRILVTGGAGFIGANFIRMVLTQYPEHQIVNFDKLTYAGNLDNLMDLAEHPNYKFVCGDISEPEQVAFVIEDIDVIVNFAAESHVDRSIRSAAPFIYSNILGVQVLLDCARAAKVSRFIQISTDEVGGSIMPGRYLQEDSPLSPSSPYAASKASAEHLTYAAYHTHGFETIITRATNNFGPYQFPEKLLPLVIANALEFKPLPIYGDGLYVRDWIYVEDHCRAIYEVMMRGRPGQIYNIGARTEYSNLAVIKKILKILDRPEKLMTHVTDRLGHDRRYAIDPSKLEQELGWQPAVDFEDGLKRTVDWYLRNIVWLARARSGEYRKYYAENYSYRKAYQAPDSRHSTLPERDEDQNAH